MTLVTAAAAALGSAMLASSGVFDEGRRGRGETVGLRFEASGCLVFPHLNGAAAE